MERLPAPAPARDLLRNGWRRQGIVILPLVIAAAVAARAWLLFGTHYVPGMNGGYYLVQARALLDRGRLGIPDLPLVFHLHAALAWCLAKSSGLAQAEAIVWAVKLCDAGLPPLVAWPVFLLVRNWAAARGASDAVPLAAASLSCFAWPWLRMAGDLQKNSLALLWFAALSFALHGWLAAPTTRRALAVLLCLLLLSLTHIGVLGAALLMLAVAIAVIFAREPLWCLRRILPWLNAAAVLLLVAGALVLRRFDPARVRRLLTALTDPAKFSTDGGPPPFPQNADASLASWLPFLAFVVVVGSGLVVAWRRRRESPVADLALVAGCAIPVLAMTGPWFVPDKAVRFYLISLVPTLVAGAFAVLHSPRAWLRRCVAGTAFLIGIVSTWPILRPGAGAILSDAALIELQALAPLIAHPEETLVCTEHGVEWWTAWLLQTRITQPSALRREDWSRYESVYFLELKSGLQIPFSPGHPDPSGVPPRELASAEITSPFGSRQRAGRGQRLPPPGEIVHEGPHFRLVRIADYPPP